MKRLLLAASLLALAATPSFARDQIRIVGSSTVYPFATVVAEAFAKSNGMIEFVTEFTSQQAIGEDGYLLDKSLVALKTCDAEWSAGTVDTLPLVDIDMLK